MDLVTYNEHGQWALAKSEGWVTDPNADHHGKPNFAQFKLLADKHGPGHFSWHPETHEIRAHSPQAVKMVNKMRTKAQEEASSVKPPGGVLSSAREKMIRQDVQSWAPKTYKKTT